MLESRSRSVLDTPLSRGMTVIGWAGPLIIRYAGVVLSSRISLRSWPATDGFLGLKFYSAASSVLRFFGFSAFANTGARNFPV
jgi:hypothetical protein